MLKQAQSVLKIEAQAILDLIPRLNGDFTAAAQMILACRGRIIVTGMGKSGLVGRKIAATLASTGTPSFFLHPAEAIHGDLGMVTSTDVILAISNSGETEEVLKILPVLKRIGTPIIVMSGKADSTLVKNADVFIDIAVEKEACPLGLVPTASTTATLAMGDALAVALLGARHFTCDDFALFHPGGSLGRKLLLTVADVMHGGADNPLISGNRTVQEALFVITAKGMGAVSIIDDSGKLQGILTDGDIRRGLEKGYEFLQGTVSLFMTRTPQTIHVDKLAAYALHQMEHHQPHPVTVLPVVDNENNAIGMIHLTDLLRQGVV